MKNKTVILALFLFLIWGCGPMNSKPQTNLDSSGLPSAPLSTGSTRISKNNHFYVYAALSSSGASSLDVGENTYLIRFAHCEDLQNPSSQAMLSVTYGMPEMPEMPYEEVIATRQENGSYAAILFFSMTGRWEVTLKIQDGSTRDEYAFEVKL